MRRPICFLRIAVCTALFCTVGAPAWAGLITSGGCVDDVTGTFFPNRVPTNCTANDVTFVLVGLGVQSDGCVDGSGDTFSIRLRAVLQNTTAQARYDVGMYLATDGDPNADGARTGTCARISLDPVGATGVTTCGAGALDLDGPTSGVDNNTVGVGDGDFLSAETGSNNSTPDSCGDLFAQGASGCDEDGDGNWDDTVLDFPADVQLPCRDLEADGFVNIPTCATWGNQADGVHDGTGTDTCDSEAEVMPETKSKCRCEDTNSTVPMPSVSCSASCTPSIVAPGGTASCTVSYTNASSCTPDPMTPERFRCGTASYLRLKTDYDQANGSISSLSTSGTGGGGGAVDDGDQIVWTPSSGFGTSGIVAQSEAATLSFDYTVDAGAGTDLSLNFSTTGFWSDDPTFATEVSQSTLTCGATISTPVTLAFFKAQKRGDAVELRWTTATEVATVGFRVYEELADGWRRLTGDVIPSAGGDSTVPRNYRLEVPASSADRFFLESLDADGSTRLHGPFVLGEGHGRRVLPEAVSWQEIRESGGLEPSRHHEAIGLGTGPRKPLAPQNPQKPQNPRNPQAVLEVAGAGIHRLTYEDLLEAGLDFAGVKVSHLALLNRGEPVGIYVQGATARPQELGPGAFVEFYGEALDTLYTRTNVYRLKVDPSAARRLEFDRRRPRGEGETFYFETVGRELRTEYNLGSPLEDPWVDTRMLAFSSARSFDFDFVVDDLLPEPASRLEVDLWGVTDLPESPDHHVQVLVNGVLLEDRVFDGLAVQRFELSLPPGLLQEGGNRMTLVLPADLGVLFDLVNFEGFRVTYPRRFVAGPGGLSFEAKGEAFEVTGVPAGDLVAYRVEKGRVQRLSGSETELRGPVQNVRLRGDGELSRYYVSTSPHLLRPGISPARPEVDLSSGTADVLVIAHGRFLDALAPWVTYRETTGLEVLVVDVADIYEGYSGGVLDAEAIAEYIRVAAGEMGIRAVLLVGGDSYDYRDDLGLGSISFIPSLYRRTGEIVRFAPVDPLYTDLDGDQVPDLPIGRWPVRTVAELEAIIDRTLDYEAKGYGRTALLAADSFDAGSGVSFTRHSEDLASTLGVGWSTTKAYLDSLALSDAQATIVGALDDGVAMTSYVGHSGPSGWTFAGLFDTSDARALDNGGAPTVVVQWGCWNTYFVEPRVDTLGHAFLLSGDRGAAAVLGSATLTESAAAEKLGEILMPLLAEPGKSLGEAVTEAKQQLAASDPGLLDVLLGWTLLGDPLLVIEP